MAPRGNAQRLTDPQILGVFDLSQDHMIGLSTMPVSHSMMGLLYIRRQRTVLLR